MQWMDGRTGRDVPRTNIYTGIMAPDSRGVYNKSTQYCPFITRRPSLMRALHVCPCGYVYVCTCYVMYYNIVPTCVFGDSFFFSSVLYDWFCFSVIPRPTCRIKGDFIIYYNSPYYYIIIYYVILNASTIAIISEWLYLQSGTRYCSGNLGITYKRKDTNESQ